MKNKTIIIKCTEEEYNFYKTFAELKQLTISDMIRNAINNSWNEWIDRRWKTCELPISKD